MMLHDSRSHNKHCLLRNQAGMTALMQASGNGHESVVKVLLSAKADVNRANNVRY
jgi:ankyrin repeat protein